jgi:hypothetical protein
VLLIDASRPGTREGVAQPLRFADAILGRRVAADVVDESVDPPEDLRSLDCQWR